MLYTIFQLVCPWSLHFAFLLRFFLAFLRPPRSRPFQKPREISVHPLPDPPYLPPGLFSVHRMDAILDSSSMVLSAVRIPIQWCHPEFQHANKDLKRTRPRPPTKVPTSWKTMALLLLGLFCHSGPTTYALPETNYAIVSGSRPSLDTARQQRHIQTIVESITASKSDSGDPYLAFPTDAAPTDALPTQPYCFVADTDSSSFILDSGANRFIINDAALFTSYVQQSGHVKGIGGSPTCGNWNRQATPQVR
jgi:hypothetical protein